MRRLVFSMVAVSLLCASVLGQNYDHVYRPEYQVKAYKVPEEKTSYFNADDDKMSAFWLTWYMEGMDNLDKIDINGIDDRSRGPEPGTREDGKLNIRFAYSDAGVYVLYEVLDDQWIDYLNTNNYDNDAVELFGDENSAEDLYGGLLPCINDAQYPHQLSKSYFQVQVRFGGDGLVDEINRNMMAASADPSSNCNPGTNGGLIEYNQNLTFQEVSSQFGIEIEILPEDGGWRRQEWFIPWHAWGGYTGGLAGVPNAGKVAIAVGYNDLDAGHLNDKPTAMRWRMADPYTTTEEPGTKESVDAWGELVFDQSLQTILDAAGKTWADVEATGTIRPAPSIVQRSGKIIKTEYFTPEGRKVLRKNGRMEATASGLLLKKVTFQDKSSITTKVPFTVAR